MKSTGCHFSKFINFFVFAWNMALRARLLILAMFVEFQFLTHAILQSKLNNQKCLQFLFFSALILIVSK